MHKLILCILAGILVYFIPHSLDYKAWGLFSIFFATILGLIIRPYPMGVVALLGLTTSVLTGILNIQTEALVGFQSPIIWLIIMIFFISRGVIKTQLGLRIACMFIRKLGRSPLLMGYSLVLTELCMSPLIPSNTARAGGIMLPVIRSICEALNSTPTERRRLGGYLMLIGFHANTIASAMFLTACAVNPIAQQFAQDQGVTITWFNWAAAAIVPGMLLLAILPVFLHWVAHPQDKDLSASQTYADQTLQELGPMKFKEKSMIGIFLFMLTLWIGEPYIGVQATTVAFMGVSLCFLFEILTIEDILNEKEAWHILIWLSILVTMSGFLQKFGFIPWFSQSVSGVVSGMTGVTALFVLSTIYYYSHYFFAGNTSQVSAMYAAFVMVAISAGAPPLLTTLLFGYFSSMYSATTHYGGAAGSLYYAQRYVPIRNWWLTGFLMSLLHMGAFWGVGLVWWRFLGLV